MFNMFMDGDSPICVADPPKTSAHPNYVLYQKRLAEAKSVASDPSTPVSELNKLSLDSNFQIRRAVAGNPSTPDYILEGFILDDDKPIILKTIAGRPDATEWQLRMICANGCSSIWKRDILLSVLKSPNVPVDILEKFVDDELNSIIVIGKVLSAIIRNPKAPHDLLCKIAMSEKSSARLVLAKNTGSVFLLKQLSEDADKHVRRVAQERLQGK